MTLVKLKRRQPGAADRQRAGRHHHHGHHYIKTYWPYLPIVAVLVFGFLANSWLGQLHRDVLGYATDMSTSSLLADTNSQRANNSEGPLNLNAQLNQAAQAKANDMAARNYWSHNTPDGQSPWTFITNAGYGYETAGENLAYGFATASDTVTGWMNSPEHRANILNTSYRDVGFGFVDISDYQSSGPETLVVAMYGSLPGETAAAYVPATATPPAKRSVPQQTVPQPAPAPEPAANQSTPQSDIATAKPLPSATDHPETVNPMPQQRITRLQLVATGTPSSALVLSLVVFAGFAIVSFKHGLAWRKALVRGEVFVLHHPSLDVLIVIVATLSFILSRTSGIIR